MRDWLNAALRRLPVWPFYWLGALPAAWYFWNGLQGRLGADPVKALEHEYGLIALQFLIAALCVTPLREIAGINLLRFRRMLGLMAFSYACLHLAVWLGLDRQFDWPRITAPPIVFPETVISISVEPRSSKDRDKLLEALRMLERQDPTIRISTNAETAQTLISGMGELHLEVNVERLRREMNVECNVASRRLPGDDRRARHVGRPIRSRAGREDALCGCYADD